MSTTDTTPLITALEGQPANTSDEQCHPAPFETKIEKIGTPLCLILLLIFIYFVIIWPDEGLTAIFNCRIISTFSTVLMTFSTWVTTYQWLFKKYPGEKHGTGHVSHIMQIFLCIGTAFTLYGYWNQIAFMRIFWQYDFVLSYKKNNEWENLHDIFFVVCVMYFLLSLLNYLLRVAPVVDIPPKVKWLLLLTLFSNVAQKWLYESIEFHIEICEELNKKVSICKTYIHYNNSMKDLSEHQKQLYYSFKDLRSLTYTITMEHFIACMALIVHLSHRESHTNNNDLQALSDMLSRKTSRRMWITFILCSAGLGISLLRTIHSAPILYLYPSLFRSEQVAARLGTHICNLVLGIACCINFEIKGVLKLWQKLFPWGDKDADIIILWYAFILHCVIFLSKFFFQLIFLFPSLEFKFLFFFEQLANIFEIFSFYFLILVAERLLLITKMKNLRNYENNFMKLFILIYSCITILGFVAYYSLKSLHQFPHEVEEKWGLNMLVLFESTYPSTLLFTLTLSFCFAAVGEAFYKNGFYSFNRKDPDPNLEAYVSHLCLSS